MTSRESGLSDVANALKIQPTTARKYTQNNEQAGYVSRADGRLYVRARKPGMTVRHVFLTAARSYDPGSQFALQLGNRWLLQVFQRSAQGLLSSREQPHVVETERRKNRTGGVLPLYDQDYACFLQRQKKLIFLLSYGLPGDEWKDAASVKL